jgi:putative MATE family efflux protein
MQSQVTLPIPPETAAPNRGLGMTEGPVGPLLFRLTVPLAWGILAVLGYRLAEAWFVGALGAEALAAISFAFPITMVVLSLSIGLGAGTSSVIARALGAREPGVPRLVADALILTLLLATICAVIGVAEARPLARLLGAGPSLVPAIAAYLQVWFPTAILILLPQVGLSAARAAGDATFQGVAMIASTLLNLAFVPFMISGAFGYPGFGLVGAPIATALAWLPLLFATIWRLRRLHILSFEHLEFDEFLHSSRRILRVGVPAAATNTVIPISAGIITALLAPYGHDVVAGFGLGSRVESVAMVPFFALSAVMNPFAGQNFGAGRIFRVREAMRVTATFCGVLGVALAIVLYVGRHWIASRFTSDEAVMSAAMMYLALVPLSYGPGGMIAIANAAFNGLNRPFSAVIVSVARTLLVNVPVAWIGGRVFGVPGIFLGICVSNLVVGVASGLWVLSVTTPAEVLKPCTAS